MILRSPGSTFTESHGVDTIDKLVTENAGGTEVSRVCQTFKGKDLADLLMDVADQEDLAREAGLTDTFGFEARYDSNENEWTVIHYLHV